MHQTFANRWRFPVLLLLHGAVLQAAGTNIKQSTSSTASSATTAVQVQCLPDHGGYLSARLRGSINQELSLSGAALDCTGSIRPGGKGLRLRFSAKLPNDEAKLVLLFGIRELKEGESGNALPVNLTIIREGKGEFYATQGDDKCTVDQLKQTPLKAFPFKQRAWRVEAHGFCTQPARAINQDGSVLVTRFDFVGRVEFSDEESDSDVITTAVLSPQ